MGEIQFDPGGGVPPDGAASNLAPAIQRYKSSGTAPGVYGLQALFDAATDEWITFRFTCPNDYAGGGFDLAVWWKAVSAVTGNVVWAGRLAAVTPNSDATDVDVKVFAAVNNSAATAVPATTAGKAAKTDITMTNADSIAADDMAWLYVGRPALTEAGDTAAGDMELMWARLLY